MPSLPTWAWILAGLFLALALARAGRLWLRRFFFRLAVRTRRDLGVRLNPVTLTRKAKLKSELMEDPQLSAFVRDHAAAAGRDEVALWADVNEYLEEIIPAFKLLTTYRYGKKVAGALLRGLYRVRVGRSAEAELNQIPRTASVIYVMNHRSNADYVLVAFLLANRVAISWAVGEWARVWPLERIFKSFGSFFIRRRFRDPLYHRVLERYVQRAVEAGITQGIFLEGGLSRDGGLLKPKLGLLDYMARAQADLVFIPVGLNYDRVLEDVSLTEEASRRETTHSPDTEARPRTSSLRRTAFWILGLLFRGATGRFHRLGYAVANFGAPVPAREILPETYASLDWEARKPHLEALADRLMAAVRSEIPVTPVALVAWAFRNLGPGAHTREDLETACRRHFNEAQAGGLPAYLARGEAARAVTMGIRILLLRGILVEDRGGLRTMQGRDALLDYYASSVAHHFSMDPTRPSDIPIP
ncbi:MAG: 1-acyl-sn-glycerol-3-phosphate acyltransferase [Holophagaceae bacterium]|nr:1-acyl-sn-glycerol-3-phosphate acyltransferase [Holophagaceae bacterium]